jgi:ribose 5-phosphate isomerase A
MTDINAAKLRAARVAASLVQNGMTVGLGTGTTSVQVVKVLGERVRDEGLKILGVPTSVSTAALANSLRIPIRELDDVGMLDLDIDGADEIDPNFRMIKGRGGALLREKIVACAAERRIMVVTPEKLVKRLGTSQPVPVEVSAIGTRHIEKRIKTLGAETTVRLRPDGTDYQTDGGNKIIDCRFPSGIDDAYTLDVAIQRIVGVYETGIFIGLCDLLVIGHDDRVEQVECPGRDPQSSCN